MTKERKNQIIDRKISQKRQLLENYQVDLEFAEKSKQSTQSAEQNIKNVQKEIKTLESMRVND